MSIKKLWNLHFLSFLIFWVICFLFQVIFFFFSKFPVFLYRFSLINIFTHVFCFTHVKYTNKWKKVIFKIIKKCFRQIQIQIKSTFLRFIFLSNLFNLIKQFLCLKYYILIKQFLFYNFRNFKGIFSSICRHFKFIFWHFKFIF